jgi:hypothetical protein
MGKHEVRYLAAPHDRVGKIELASSRYTSALNRMKAADDDVIITLMAAERIDTGYGVTNRPTKGYGAVSAAAGHGLAIASGQEIVESRAGTHQPVLANSRTEGTPFLERCRMHPRALASDWPLSTTEWPQRKGALQNDYTLDGADLLAHVVLGKSDSVELLQFASYRPKSDWPVTTCCSTAAFRMR